jgi:hypothetical protein
MKPKITDKDNSVFKTHKSYSPEEVLAAGGTTAFALKHGKDRDSLIKALENLPPIEPFTEEEWTDLMQQVARDK